MKTLLVDAIIGAGFPTLTLALTAEKAGLARFSSVALGAPSHIWLRVRLEEESVETLKTVYEGLREEREAQLDKMASEPAAPPPIVLPTQLGVH